MDVNLHTIKDLRAYISGELKPLYPAHEITALSNIIIKTVTGSQGLHHVYNSAMVLSHDKTEKAKSICEELKKGKPIQYILGETIFYNLVLKVNPSVLIPRQETEELVHLIIKENEDFRGSVIDFGTGSGCIAIALASVLKNAEVTGIDISEKALETADLNARLNNVVVRFIKGDVLNFDPDPIGKAGIIVSNPPYVRDSEKQYMHKNVIDFEPHSALFVSDERPLLYYESILHTARQVLIPGGKIYFEINEALGKSVTDLLYSENYHHAEVIKDLNDKDRIVKAIKNG